MQSLFTKIGQVLTVNIEHTRSQQLDNNSFIYIYDGEVSTPDRYFFINLMFVILYYIIKNKIYIFRLLATISVLNNTVPQSITSSRNNILIQFSAPARTNVFGLLRVTSGFGEN